MLSLFGKARKVLEAQESNSIAVITYGMGVYWTTSIAQHFQDQIELIDLRTIVPLDKEAIIAAVKKCNKCLVITEEPKEMSFAQSIAGMITEECFEYLDGPVKVLGSENVPAIPLNSELEAAMLPNKNKVKALIEELLAY